MKNKIIILLILISNLTLAQKIEIDTLNQIRYNNTLIKSGIKREKIKEIFGTPDRIDLGANIIWTYDSLGFMIYIDPQSLKIKNISLNFKKEKYRFSPKNKFKGEFIIYNNRISEYTTIKGLESIEKIKKYEYSFPVYSMYLNKILLYIFQSTKIKTELSGCEINI